MDVVRSNSVAVAPPCSVPRTLQALAGTVKRKRVVLRVPGAETAEGKEEAEEEVCTDVERWERCAWRAVSKLGFCAVSV